MSKPDEDDLRPEYDFSELAGTARGKYVERYKAGSNVVVLDPDVADAFPDARCVNEALRKLTGESQSRTT